MPDLTDDNHLRIVLADDHQLVRGALARLIRSFAGMEVVAEAEDGRQLVRALDEVEADLAIVDAKMPVYSGVDAVREITRTWPGLPVLVLSMYTSPEYVRRAREVGAHGFVAKDVDAAGFEDAIRRVAQGEAFVRAPEGLGIEGAQPAPQGAPGEAGETASLTLRQREVLQLVVQGYRTKDIARRLGVSVKTVETHRADLMRRLGVGNMAALVREALRRDLLPPA